MRRLSIAAISALILLALVAAPTQAQEETEEEGNVIIDVILPLSLAFIMFSLGVGLTTEDFSLVIREPKAFGIGLANQMVVLPIMGFLIASAANLEGELAVGMMILACCPGGVTSNILTKLAKGDTALSISYTAVVSVATVITLPVIVGFSMDHFMGEAAPEIDILGLGITMFLLTTMPVLVGMAVRHYSPTKADSVEGGVNLVAAVLFVIIILAAIASEWDTLMDNIGTLGPAVIALNFLMLSIGYQSAKLLDLEIIRATTVSIESGIQNATVGITVGGLILAAPDGGLSTLSLPSGVYGVLMYLVIAPLIYWRINSNET
ncbi:MAG: bile acid:sodium symporter family protein [Candidatus Thalassarchaeaceae archaeon]|nr:bile acid:sodium symporter family protein [Candidatus Thalassarchaeaceae archaeon]MDP7003610.1 bile acid:sodium symporter family protein [Candidatus Thalassarchaeaceae archaeon]